METVSTYSNFSNESTGIYFLYPRNFIIKLLSGGLSKRIIAQAELFLYIFLIFLLSLCIYLMYNTVDSISSQLAILHIPGVIYMPSRNGPEHIYMD